MVALAILKSERVVVLRSRDIGSGINSGGNFIILDLAILVKW